MSHSRNSSLHRFGWAALAAAVISLLLAPGAPAHPLGNFTINHFTRIEIKADRIALRWVVDMAEIPAFQQLQRLGVDGSDPQAVSRLGGFLDNAAADYGAGLLVTVDGVRILLRPESKKISLPSGAGGLPTLRVECDYSGALPGSAGAGAHRLRFEDGNDADRIGWREIVAAGSAPVSVFDSSAFGDSLTEELKVYPQDMLSAPLNERSLDLSFTNGAAPAGSSVLRTRDGRAAHAARDRFAELITVNHVTPLVALAGLLIAAGLGAVHALSPGHGKTIVGAYLVGSRGTMRHAAFLGLTVTVTHTIGVFALGLVTQFASRYVVPERLFPILSALSGAIVLLIGFSLFVGRLRTALRAKSHSHDHSHPHRHNQAGGASDRNHDHHHDGHQDHDHDTHGHSHAAPGIAHTHLDHHQDAQLAAAQMLHSHPGHGQEPANEDGPHAHSHGHGGGRAHSHGGKVHTHVIPGADGAGIGWRNLLALGISGGLLPCPSALVVLLSAISLHRIGYGLVLVVAFSFGLATTLTAVGLLFLYAGRLLKRPVRSALLVRLLPLGSAFVIMCAGAAICYEALR